MVGTFATNAASNSAMNYLNRNSSAQSSSIAKLSSGSRIVKASDDAASLAVGTKLKADVTALKQAGTNASQAASLLQIADGALSRIGDTLMRMKSLATQARSDVLSKTERGYLNEEFKAMQEQIDFISSSTTFNGTAVISGALGAKADAASNGTAGSGANVVNVDDSKVTMTGSVEGTYRIQYDGGTLTVSQYAAGTGTADGAAGDVYHTTPGAPTATESIALDNTNTDFTGTVNFSSLGVQVNFDKFDLARTDDYDDIATHGGGEFDNALEVTGNAAKFQMGVAAGTDDIEINVVQTDLASLRLETADVNIKTIGATDTEGARLANIRVDDAIETINTQRATLGANMSRVEKIGENIATTVENLDAARSVLMDVDVAEEMTKFTTNQVMSQAATAMLAQANQLPQNLMRLLQ